MDFITFKDIYLLKGVSLTSLEEKEMESAIITISPPQEVSLENIEVINEKKVDEE